MYIAPIIDTADLPQLGWWLYTLICDCKSWRVMGGSWNSYSSSRAMEWESAEYGGWFGGRVGTRHTSGHLVVVLDDNTIQNT